MEPFQMLQISTYLFGIAALGGVAMGFVRFTSGANPPSWLAMLHGFLAGAGLTLLAYAAATMNVPAFAYLSLLLFAGGAAGGVFLNLHYHLRQIPLPKWLVIVHAGVNVLAFVLLCFAAFAGA
ncbi:hypothetical protein [Massilia cavernae]|uniref:Uncharacterized protein n=1 Tax=Massilia cavernae TaxID=2320864 RepID=A0A418XGI2_9BURK|nr:hypothetical protein [Massilia cavernae]RJG11572.1 hypothetical protein D3872_19045 [Massilia cavernae]